MNEWHKYSTRTAHEDEALSYRQLYYCAVYRAAGQARSADRALDVWANLEILPIGTVPCAAEWHLATVGAGQSAAQSLSGAGGTMLALRAPVGSVRPRARGGGIAMREACREETCSEEELQPASFFPPLYYVV
jgi:hypothetical protein